MLGSVSAFSMLMSINFSSELTSRTLQPCTTEIWQNIGNGQGIEEAITNAEASTRSHYWTKEIFGWGYDTLLQYELRSIAGILQNRSANNQIDNITLNKEHLFLEDSKIYYKYCDDYSKSIKYIKLKDGLLTNEIYSVRGDQTSMNYNVFYNNGIEVKSMDKFIIKNVIQGEILHENDFCLYINGEANYIKRMQVNVEIEKGIYKLEEHYYNITTKMYLSEDFIINAFGG